MPNAPNNYLVETKLYWPIVVPVAPFVNTFLLNNEKIDIEVGQRESQNINDTIAISTSNFTFIRIGFYQKHQGDRNRFLDWCNSDTGKEMLFDKSIFFQSSLMTWFKTSHPYDSQLAAHNHYGPSNLPYIEISTCESVILKNVHPLYITSGLRPLTLVAKDGTLLNQASSTFRFIIRSVELVDSGYPTEALLLAVSCLDSLLQKALTNGMIQLGIDKGSADTQLRNITQSRFSTYLDPLFKLVFGVSLKEEHRRTFNKMSEINKLRNEAIHSGIDVKRNECMDAILTVYKILEFINQYSNNDTKLPPMPAFFKII